MAVSNPRWPHRCEVYRMEGETSFEDGVKRVLYSGVCRKYGNTGVRTFERKDVVRADYGLSLPGTVEGIRAGDLIDVEDRTGTYRACLVVECYAGNLGTTVQFNLAKN